MNYRNAALAVLLAALLSFAFVADDADAADDVEFGDLTVVHDFDDMGKGSITVYLDNNSAESKTVTVRVYEWNTDNERAAVTTVLAPYNEEAKTGLNQEIGLSFGYNSAGHKYIDVRVYDENGTQIGYSDAPIEIDVGHNIWKDSMTYIVIIIVIIVIVAIAYLYIRNAPKRKAKKMTDTTFTDLEAQRQKKKSERKSSVRGKSEGKKKE